MLICLRMSCRKCSAELRWRQPRALPQCINAVPHPPWLHPMGPQFGMVPDNEFWCRYRLVSRPMLEAVVPHSGILPVHAMQYTARQSVMQCSESAQESFLLPQWCWIWTLEACTISGRPDDTMKSNDFSMQALHNLLVISIYSRGTRRSSKL